MYYLLAGIFLVILFTYYYLLGEQVVRLLKIKENSTLISVIGFLTFFFISFMVGFPAQVFHVSWAMYYLIARIIFIGLFVVLLINKLVIEKINLRKIFDSSKRIIKENWLLFLIIAVFMFMIMINKYNFSIGGYDDNYYISKIVHNINAPHLLSENYWTGELEKLSGLDLVRIFNTFEITYGFLGTLSHISIPFFVKYVMNIHSLVIIMLVYKLFAYKIVGRKNAQYALLFFILFVIPIESSLTNSAYIYKYYMQDYWQFSLKAYYGGSLVKIISFPIFLLEFDHLYKNRTFRSIVLLGITCVTFAGFSTIYSITFCMVALGYVFILLKDFVSVKYNHVDVYKRNAILAVIFFFVLFIIEKILERLFAFTIPKNDYFSFYKNNISTNLYFLAIPFLLTYLYLKKKSRILLTSGIIFIIIYLNIYGHILLFPSLKIAFVVKRFIASVQLLFPILLGCVCVTLINENKLVKKHFVIFSLAVLLAVPSGLILSQRQMNKFVLDGVRRNAYDLSLITNKNALPQVFDEVGDYFNSLPSGHYKMFAVNKFYYDNVLCDGNTFLTCSDRVVLCYYDKNKHGNINSVLINKLNLYANNRISFNDIKSILRDKKIQYLFVANKDVARDLLTRQFEAVKLSNNKEKTYYLFKTPESLLKKEGK